MFRPTETGTILKYVIKKKKYVIFSCKWEKYNLNTSTYYKNMQKYQPETYVFKVGVRFSNLRHLLLVASIILTIVYEVNTVILSYFSRTSSVAEVISKGSVRSLRRIQVSGLQIGRAGHYNYPQRVLFPPHSRACAGFINVGANAVSNLPNSGFHYVFTDDSFYLKSYIFLRKHC